MLGLKRYKNLTLDLWVGKTKDFFCDLMVFFETPPKEALEAEKTLKLSLSDDFLEKISPSHPKRHLVFVIPEGLEPLSFLNSLKDFLSSPSRPESITRVTLLLENLKDHDPLQDKIAEIF